MTQQTPKGTKMTITNNGLAFLILAVSSGLHARLTDEPSWTAISFIASMLFFFCAYREIKRP